MVIVVLFVSLFVLNLSAEEDFYFDKQEKKFLISGELKGIEKKINQLSTVILIKQACYNWFKNQQQPNGLVENYEGGGVSYSYDDALAAFVFILNDNIYQAKKVFDFFETRRKEQMRDYNKFIGFADMYYLSGKIGNKSRAVGPNAWLLLALNYYMLKTQDNSYIKLAKAIADWILGFQDKYNGGIWGGVNDKGGKFLWMSTEHNLDAYAAFEVLYKITGEEKYHTAASKIKEWLTKEMWNPWTKRFYNGLNDPNYATDVSSWAVLSLLEPKYFGCLDFAIKYSENEQFYEPNKVKVKGFDFGSTYAESPYPDKDAVWFEGTGQMVLAFYLASRTNEAKFYLNELKKAVVKSEKHNDSAGLPYASNPGSPPYGGWVMPDKPICASSTAWFLFALKKFNPFYGNIIQEKGQEISPAKMEKQEEKEKIQEEKSLEEELFGD